MKENTTELVDPLDIKKKIESLEEKNNTLLKELDTQIKVSNATTLIEIDNFVILSRLLHTSIEDILVIDGDIVRLWGFSFKLLVQ